jgi:hypothetical protein
MDTNEHGKRESENIQYNNKRRCYRSTTSTSGYDTTDAMDKSTTTTMENTSKKYHLNTTHSNKPSTRGSTGKNENENTRRRYGSESSTSSGESGTTIEEEDEDNTGKTYFTFIIHKTNQSPNWQQAKRYKPSPTFITFDHGTHYHILYASDDRGGNGARQRGRIAGHLGATTAGNTEINATNNKVRFRRRFILYCIRNGIETANKYGTRINKEMREAYEIFMDLYNTRDPNDIHMEIGRCKQYIEDAKHDTRIGKQRRKNIVDTIMDLLNQYNINTNTDWNIQIDAETKHQLMREYGLTVDNYVQRLIRARKHANMKYYKHVPLGELLAKEIETYMNDNEKVEPNFHECCDWIEYLFKENNLDLNDFLAWNTCIKDMRYTKINTLVLQGPTNAGKSLIADSLVALCKPEEVSRERDKPPPCTCIVTFIFLP